MEAGDFNETPASSGRPSLSLLRPDESSTAPTVPTSPPKGAGYRHHLLKTSASGALLADGNPPIPPILSPTLPESAARASFLDQSVVHGNQNPSSVQLPAVATGSLPTRNLKHSAPSYMYVKGQECLGPEFHLHKTHGQAHHPGLLKGGDFCDSGEPTHGVRDVSPSSSESNGSDSSFSERSGETHERSREGLLTVERVKIPVHRHKGHSHAVKVRPAFQPDLFYHPGDHEHRHGSVDGGQQGKVGPFISELEEPYASSEPPAVFLSDKVSQGPTQSVQHISKVGPAFITFNDG